MRRSGPSGCAKWADGEYDARMEPSELLVAWVPRISKGRALDLACGNGRNVIYLAEQGFTVDAVDIAAPALELVRDTARKRGLNLNLEEADLDEYVPSPQTYDLIATSFFINRNLIPRVKDALKPGGFVLHEHHFVTDYDVDGPQNLQFRLRPNELLHLFTDFRVRFYWEGLQMERGRLIAVEQLVAQKAPASEEPPPVNVEQT